MTKVRHKASSGVQRLKCRLRQAREHRVAVVQPHRYQRQHKEDGDAFANMAADLAESANVEEADCYDLAIAICFLIVSSESNRTPRSRTTSEGLM